jgi:hypothetical protein
LRLRLRLRLRLLRLLLQLVLPCLYVHSQTLQTLQLVSLLAPPLLLLSLSLSLCRGNILHHHLDEAIAQTAIQNADDREQRTHERGGRRPQP